MSRSIEYRVEEYTEVISGVTHLRKKLHIEQLDVFITILNSTILKNTYKVLTLFFLRMKLTNHNPVATLLSCSLPLPSISSLSLNIQKRTEKEVQDARESSNKQREK